MRELLPVISDDLDWTEKQVRTPATADRHLGWEGKWYLLDLTDEHDAELCAMIKRYVEAGQQADQPKLRRSGVRQSTYRSDQPHGRRTKRYYDDLTVYVDERGLTKRDGSGRPAYAGKDGSKDFPNWLVEEYDAYLAGISDG